jgi:hypothetical protein
MARNIKEDATAVLAWAYLTESDLATFLATMSKVPENQRPPIMSAWSKTAQQREVLSKLPLADASIAELDEPARAWCEQSLPIFAALVAQFPNSRFATVPTDQLVMPLTMIDEEYVEQLRGTLTGTTAEDIVRFSIPDKVKITMSTALDPSGRSASVLTTEKTVTFAPMAVHQIPGVGVEVRIVVIGTPQLILVTRVAGRLFLRSGVHRAYLLASLGIKQIPCLVSEEDRVPLVVGIYPAFAPNVLALPRPPMLRDMFDQSLTTRIPIVRATKVLRVTADEFMVPND